jgi:RecA-family ATPase
VNDEATSPRLLPLVWASQAEPGLDVDYVVKGIVAAGELVVIYGPPKSGKTFLATDMGLSVAAEQPWFGRRVRGGLVIYIASEMGSRVLRRVRA